MKLRYRPLLTILSAFFIGTTALWIFKNNLPPAWDQAQYLEASDIMHQTLVNDGFFKFLNKTTTILTVKAPLIAILPVPLYLVFGSSPHVALTINLIFMLIFYIFFYKLISLVFNRKIAILSSTVISTMPLFYGLVRYFYAEFGLLTITVVWLYFLQKSEFLTKKKYLLLLGLIFGLGMLMKFHFFIFIAGPAIVVVYRSWRKIGVKIFDFKNALIFTLPALLIALPWYLRNIPTLLWKVKRSSSPDLLGNLYYGPSFSFNNLYFSALDFINYAISFYWFVVLLVFTTAYIFKKGKYSINYFLLSWFLVPFLVFYLGPNKDYRLILPLLPPIAVLAAKLIEVLSSKKYIFIIFTLIVFPPTFIYLNTSVFGAKLIQNRVSAGPLVIADKTIGDYVKAPRSESWPIVELLNYIAKLSDDEQKTVILASEDEIFNINSLKYYATHEKIPLTIKTASYFPQDTSYDVVEVTIDQGDYLVMKTGGNIGPADLNRFNNLTLQNLDHQKWRELEHNITLPDGGKIKIWQKGS